MTTQHPSPTARWDISLFCKCCSIAKSLQLWLKLNFWWTAPTRIRLPSGDSPSPAVLAYSYSAQLCVSVFSNQTLFAGLLFVATALCVQIVHRQMFLPACFVFKKSVCDVTIAALCTLYAACTGTPEQRQCGGRAAKEFSAMETYTKICTNNFCFCSATMLTSKIITKIIGKRFGIFWITAINLFQLVLSWQTMKFPMILLWKGISVPVAPFFVGSGGKYTRFSASL